MGNVFGSVQNISFFEISEQKVEMVPKADWDVGYNSSKKEKRARLLHYNDTKLEKVEYENAVFNVSYCHSGVKCFRVPTDLPLEETFPYKNYVFLITGDPRPATLDKIYFGFHFENYVAQHKLSAFDKVEVKKLKGSDLVVSVTFSGSEASYQTVLIPVNFARVLQLVMNGQQVRDAVLEIYLS